MKSDMRVKKKCPVCNGRGWYLLKQVTYRGYSTAGTVVCKRCNFSGKVYV